MDNFKEANARINQLINVKPTNKRNTMKTTINIQPNMKETLSNIEHLYLDYVNNFLLVSTFADYYGIDEVKANKIIDLGRFINRNK